MMYRKFLFIGIISASTLVVFHNAAQANEVNQAKGKLRHLSESHVMLSRSARQAQVEASEKTGKLGHLYGSSYVCLNNPRPECANPEHAEERTAELPNRLKVI
ncbi:hypothetical protein Lepto7376_3991 [[Leptolyngbya] sp. PCC 7376]|uniref:hypothetical protein n=1 Tax=[Leptolyngbya] sp. PCC 7376 TaxID=111781 RepID=UPI00029F2C63|nr:hypothetical protein [[Leptolyngbya] sp. PCC 7376]AFY40130.1 hypothetical protein Lepto7376_3991 [[Leptolyngbya] sp. PCC 7376]